MPGAGRRKAGEDRAPRGALLPYYLNFLTILTFPRRAAFPARLSIAVGRGRALCLFSKVASERQRLLRPVRP